MKKAKRSAARKTSTRQTKRTTRRARPSARVRPKRAAKPTAARAAGHGHGKRQVLDVFAREFPITLKLMKSYSGADDFTPHERSMPASRLAYTFSMNNGIAIKAITGELYMPPEFPPAPATYTEAVDNYERGARELLAALDEMPESRLSETVDFFTGPGQIGPVSVGDLLWLMLLDSIHHRGQLSVYVRMAGGRVPSIYGPSADEPWN